MRFRQSREGYLLVDHSASPGLPEDVAKEAGYDPEWTIEGKVFETSTLRCVHCGRVTPKSALKGREYAECRLCNFYVCDHCALEASKPDYIHLPFQKFVDISADYAIKTGQPLGTNSKLLLKGLDR